MRFLLLLFATSFGSAGCSTQGAACAAANGFCVGGSPMSCAVPASSEAQDCTNPAGESPAGATCCLSRHAEGTGVAEAGVRKDAAKDAAPNLDANVAVDAPATSPCSCDAGQYCDLFAMSTGTSGGVAYATACEPLPASCQDAATCECVLKAINYKWSCAADGGTVTVMELQ